MDRRPIVIVGSGPAGAAAALFLHRLDPSLASETLVLEKARHPRAKVCAGGLIPAALRTLDELGVELSVPHVAVHGALVTTPTTTVEHREANMCYVVRRAEFDASLVAACTARGITVHQEEPVSAIQRDERGVRIETARGTYHARLVIGADGAGSLVRRRLVTAEKTRVARGMMCDVPIRDVSWRGFGERRYEFDFRRVAGGLRGYRWIFPCLIDGEPYANVGAYSLEAKGAGLTDALSEYVDRITEVEPRRVSFPIHWYGPRAAVAGPHILLAGDAAGVDPLMGEGISIALEYGRFVGLAATEALRTGDLSGAEYQRRIETSWLGKKLRRLHLATRLFYGPTWRFWFGAVEHSERLRALGLRWYNGIDDWDRRSGWAAAGALFRAS